MPINYEAAKTLVNGLIQKMKSFRGNWEQNDPNADDYIKNRPFYTEQKEIILIPETSVTETDQSGLGFASTSFVEIEVGKSYGVIFDGVSYSCKCYLHQGVLCLGNASILGAIDSSLAGTDTGEPFLFVSTPDENSGIYTPTVDTHTIKITTFGTVIHKIDSKYLDLPDMEYISYSKYQDLTYDQQSTVLSNVINALCDEINDMITARSLVSYSYQSLNDSEKAQARTNIGAASVEELDSALNLITTADIDTICGSSIQSASEVTF